MELSHLDAEGHIRMVDVGNKPDTERVAVARGVVQMRPETLRLIVEKGLPKGDVLTTAQVAGVLAAKQTATLIPLCHPLPLTQVDIGFDVDESAACIHITATVRTHGKTGGDGGTDRRQHRCIDHLRHGESRREDHAHHRHPPDQQAWRQEWRHYPGGMICK